MLEGDYEFLSDGEWKRVPTGETVHAWFGPHLPQRWFHYRQNVVFVAPAGLEKYLEEISPLSVPDDMPQVLAISERYGISIVI